MNHPHKAGCAGDFVVVSRLRIPESLKTWWCSVGWMVFCAMRAASWCSLFSEIEALRRQHYKEYRLSTPDEVQKVSVTAASKFLEEFNSGTTAICTSEEMTVTEGALKMLWHAYEAYYFRAVASCLLLKRILNFALAKTRDKGMMANECSKAAATTSRSLFHKQPFLHCSVDFVTLLISSFHWSERRLKQSLYCS